MNVWQIIIAGCGIFVVAIQVAGGVTLFIAGFRGDDKSQGHAGIFWIMGGAFWALVTKLMIGWAA